MTQSQNTDEMPKAYEPGKVESKWYPVWVERGYFTPKPHGDKNPFVIIMPPTNITGELHLGHALTATLEDIMVRWHRMRGEPTLWLPGVDHAGIATQVVVERELAKEGIDRHQLGREKFLERVWQWANKYRNTIIEEHKRMGASLDWSRLRFTMDDGPSLAVRTAFVRLYHKGLIYRGERIINWCPRCATALSDLEVDHQDISGNLYYIRYRFAEGEGHVTVATTRPETLLGDTAVAVNPEDERFKAAVGKNVIVPAVKRVIPIIGDEAVDPAFGAGALKITPAHDPVDFEVAQRHNLPLVNIFNPDATLNENAGPYAGQERFAARKAVLADLEKEGLLEKIEPYAHSVGHCQRCRTMVEPLASKQWFVKMQPLAEPAVKAVQDGRIAIVPNRFVKVYLNWMENIRDWCISRQLWWGHQIPVWYCQECGELTVAVDTPETCAKCKSARIQQDPDVLDTWFSSALWPHSTLGWPNDTEDMRRFYPTTVMETAYDILFFWVARMIVMGLEDTDEIPFQTVYLHGLIRDEKGEKMSKTRGNVLDPVPLLEQYGTDAVRFALLTGTAPGNDSKLSTTKLEAGRNFANKLWNAARYVVRSIEPGRKDVSVQWASLPTEDRWILSRLNRTIASVDEAMANFHFEEAQSLVHGFLWSEYCDWYIEMAKIRLRQGGMSPIPVLVHVLETALRLLHPFMPFVTEEVWQTLRSSCPPVWQKTDSIMLAAYPESDAKAIDAGSERLMETVVDIIRAIRNARAEHNVESGVWVEAQVHAGELTPAVTTYMPAIESLARAKPLTFLDKRREARPGENVLVCVLKEAEVVIPMESMVDVATERARLQKEIEENEAEGARLEVRLQDQQFLTRAPAAVVEKERNKLASIKDKLARLKQELARLQ
ncbi:MAG: valine--tRNA ligase [Chloroflexi bacterium RBG_16_57_8]|nr:MAG: valine--tRNA ligase [Chloroflexi bacterium RBG_16_57_8]